MAGLEQVQDIFDRGGVGLVLVGMPGLEERLPHYPQLYSRIGFVHEFRPPTPEEVRQRLRQRWRPSEVPLPELLADDEGVARADPGDGRKLPPAAPPAGAGRPHPGDQRTRQGDLRGGRGGVEVLVIGAA